MPPTKTVAQRGNSLSSNPREDDHWGGQDYMETRHGHPRYYRPREGQPTKYFLCAENVGFEPSENPKTGLTVYDSYMVWFANRRNDLPELLSHDGTYQIFVPEDAPRQVEHFIRPGGNTEPDSTNLHRIPAFARVIDHIVPSNLTQYMTPITFPANAEWFKSPDLSVEYTNWQEVYNSFKELLQQNVAEVQSTTSTHQKTSSEEQQTIDEGREHLFNELFAAFDVEPFENGIAHPTEQIIGRALQNEKALAWFGDFCTDVRHPDFAASVLRCLGRQADPGTDNWRSDLIRRALETDDVEIRDAAVQVVESWGGKDLVDILKLHNEPEHWIRDYILEVIEDLGM